MWKLSVYWGIYVWCYCIITTRNFKTSVNRIFHIFTFYFSALDCVSVFTESNLALSLFAHVFNTIVDNHAPFKILRVKGRSNFCYISASNDTKNMHILASGAELQAVRFGYVFRQKLRTKGCSHNRWTYWCQQKKIFKGKTQIICYFWLLCCAWRVELWFSCVCLMGCCPQIIAWFAFAVKPF
jgi:hypothetical protein